MNTSLKDPQITPATEPPPPWREVEESDWFQSATRPERQRIAEHWAGELRAAAQAMPDYSPENSGWIGEVANHARRRAVDVPDSNAVGNAATVAAQGAVRGTGQAVVGAWRLGDKLLGEMPQRAVFAAAHRLGFLPDKLAELGQKLTDMGVRFSPEGRAMQEATRNAEESGRAIESLADVYHPDPARQHEFWQQVAGALGSLAPAAVSPGTALPVIAGQMGEAERERAKSEGDSDELADAKFKLGAAGGGILGVVPEVKLAKPLLSAVAKVVAGSAANTVQDAALQKAIDPDKPVDRERLKFSAIFGSMFGAMAALPEVQRVRIERRLADLPKEATKADVAKIVSEELPAENYTLLDLLKGKPDALNAADMDKPLRLLRPKEAGEMEGEHTALRERTGGFAYFTRDGLVGESLQAKLTELGFDVPTASAGYQLIERAMKGEEIRPAGHDKPTAADDTGMNMPERREDLVAQQAQLQRGERTTQMFPLGTEELPLPDGMQRVETPRGVFHFDPRRMTADEILSASKAGKENELLGLGPFDKAEIHRRAAAGEPVATVTERGPNGEELRSALATPSTAAETKAAMEAGKGEGSRVELEALPDTLGRRVGDAEASVASEKPASGEGGPDYGVLAGELKDVRERIAQRPAAQFKAKIETPDANDASIVDDVAQYARLTDRAGEDFGAWAERMVDGFGDRVRGYLPMAWDAVSAGKPVMDLTAPENPQAIEGAWTRALKLGRLFYEGSADVLRRGGYRELADAVNRHVDLAERNLAQTWGFVKPAAEHYMGAGKLLRAEEGKQVAADFADYYRAKENGRPAEAAAVLANAAPPARKLIDAVERLFEFTGYQNQRLGVKAFDRESGTWRPVGNLGKDYWPRMFNDETAAVLRDPSTNPARWEQMKQDLLENGNIATLAEADRFLRDTFPRERADDFFSNLELARTGKLPESFYEYDFWKVVPRFVSRWAERSAQIEAYGQKIGETGHDAFDRALAQTRNETSRNYIEATREHAYRITRGDPAVRKLLGNVTGATSGLMLGNPYSAVRNLIGGVAQTVNQHGLVRSLRGLREMWNGISDAEAAGAVKADVADLVFGGEGSNVVRAAVSVAMKAGGFGPAESFVRAHSYLTAKAFLRDAIAAARENPNSRNALQSRAFIQRLGVDADALFAENLKGGITDTFLRGAVRDAQGGYKFNQVPLFMDSPLGRFLWQFGRWGSQAMRFHAQNTFGPAVLGDVVRVNEGGKIVEHRVRTLMPLLRSPLVAVGAGALTLALRDAALGIARNDAGWDEIWRTKNDDERRAFTLATERLFNDVVFAGTFGAVTDYSALLRDAVTQNRFKNPIEPPAASILKEAGALAYKLAKQGQLTAGDYERFFGAVVSGYRVGSQLAYNFADRLGADWERARLRRADSDTRFVRSLGYRFADEAGIDENPYRSDWLPNVGPQTPHYSRIEDALLLGDAHRANRLAAEYLIGVDAGKFQAARAALIASVRARQPVKPGGRTGAELQDVFLEWSRQRLSDGQYRRLIDIEGRYLQTAERAQLLPVGTVWRWRQMADKPKPVPRIQHAPLDLEAVLQSVGLTNDD